MISVIIPTYNRLELLKTTLNNLFHQTQQADEIIIVDDHSSDGTFEYLQKELSDKVIALKTKGKGPGAARNTGLEIATGDYIKFFDSDDVMTLNSLEVQCNTLKKSNQPLVYSPYVHANYEKGTWIQKDVILQHKPIPQTRSLNQCMLYGFFTVIPAMLFQRNFIDEIGKWREDIVAYEDWDFLWRISKYTKSLSHTNECLMFYRFHDEQTTNANFSNTQRDKNKISCLLEILAKGQHNFTAKQLLTTEYFKTLNLLEQSKIPLQYKIIDLYKRFRNKHERLRTKTNWERMHGPCSDPKVFQHYLSLL